ncbi:MAG: prolipoprotein diacylglyceryl transferase [Desulfobacterota bacterium]|nr:prolipoprotein diacylglyceryl transferase [Thermodesulfobacteriota bacterium]
MHPILLEFAGISIKTYGFFIAIGFLAAIAIAVKEARRIGYDPQLVLDMAFYMILGAIIGSRLFYVFTHLSAYRDNPLDMLKIWEGGLTFFGGFILAAVACVWMAKKHGCRLWQTFDLFAPSLAVGVFFGRIGCFFAGCCYGRECTLPWAVTFTNPHSLAPLHVPLHPTQLYAAAGAALTFLVLLILKKRKSFEGQLALAWMFCYCVFRLIEELFRGDMRGDLLFNRYPASQVFAVVMLVTVIAGYPVLRRRK